MTTKEIISALRRGMLSDTLLQLAADTIQKLESENDRQKAEIEALQMENKQLQSDVITANQYYEHTKEQLEKAIKISQRSNQRFKEAKKELNETQEKLEALLCEATGGMLSKHTYTAEVMITQAHEHLLKCCYDEVKEFAEGLKKKTYPFPCAVGVENAVTVRAINDYVEEYCG